MQSLISNSLTTTEKLARLSQLLLSCSDCQKEQQEKCFGSGREAGRQLEFIETLLNKINDSLELLFEAHNKTENERLGECPEININ